MPYTGTLSCYRLFSIVNTVVRGSIVDWLIRTKQYLQGSTGDQNRPIRNKANIMAFKILAAVLAICVAQVSQQSCACQHSRVTTGPITEVQFFSLLQ